MGSGRVEYTQILFLPRGGIEVVSERLSAQVQQIKVFMKKNVTVKKTCQLIRKATHGIQ